MTLTPETLWAICFIAIVLMIAVGCIAVVVEPKCPLCGSRSTQPRADPHELQVQCRDCGTVYRGS